MQRKHQQPVILSVSELNKFARGVLEMHIGQIKVSGEISNLSRPASGHWYFTLKDDNAQIRCAMFRHRNQLLRQRIEAGMQVIVHGTVSLYEGRGDYQLIADFVEEFGLGALQRKFEMLKQQLLAEGLFASQHKKPLPKNIQHIAVITSKTGAVIHDIIHVLNKRYPLMRISLIAASVQGETAVKELCQALDKAQQWNKNNPEQAFDAVIIGRGGGSLEDLWAFNEEKLARAIFACTIPIISAVGHETDTTIADFVADFRAPTPSAAAEMLSPDISNLYQMLDGIEQVLQRNIHSKLQQQNALLKALQHGLKHPADNLRSWQKQFAGLSQQLQQQIKQQLQAQKHQLQLAEQGLKANSPEKKLLEAKQCLQSNTQALLDNWQDRQLQKQQQLQLQAKLLDLVSPLATLQRGYSISQLSDGKVLQSSQQAQMGDTLHTRLHQGTITSKIVDIKESHDA